MGRNEGFTLLELMLSMSIFLVVMGSFFALWRQVQLGSADLVSLFQRDENLYLGTLLLSRWVPPGGNHRQEMAQSGISSTPDLLQVNSDIDGDSGFPDASLEQSFERLTLRERNRELQLRSGNGYFQSLIKGISDFQLDLSTCSVELRLEAGAATLLPTGEENLRIVSSRFFLWNYRPNLFAKKP